MLTALRISSIDISTITRVPAGEHAVHADAEQHGAEQQELVEEQSATQSFRARTMAPMSAASRSTDTDLERDQVGREDASR